MIHNSKLVRIYTKISNPLIDKGNKQFPLFFKDKIPEKFIPKKQDLPIQYNYKKEPYIDSLDKVINEYNNQTQPYYSELDNIKNVNKQTPVYLSEVIKTPSKRDIKTKEYIQKLIPNKNTRDDLYKVSSYLNIKDQNDINNNKAQHISDNDSALRLARLYNESGQPNINRLSIQDNIGLKKDRAYMTPGYFTNDDLYVNTPEDLIAELSHSYGEKTGLIPRYKIGLTNILYGSPDNYYEKGKTGYNNPRHYEYQTHSVVQPNIRNFLKGNIKSMDIKDLNNKINQINEQRIDRFGTSFGRYLLDSVLSSNEK